MVRIRNLEEVRCSNLSGLFSSNVMRNGDDEVNSLKYNSINIYELFDRKSYVVDDLLDSLLNGL